MLRAVAPAKVNLTLHVLGRRSDGYHELESLVAFTLFGDEVLVERADRVTLSVGGPMAGDLGVQPDNLVLRAAQLLAARAADPRLGARITLTKNIPLSAGLGGGSSDAAATLKLLNRLWRLKLEEAELEQLSLSLGADLPVCVRGRASLMTGIGEHLSEAANPVAGRPVVLAHTRKQLPTPAVFRELKPSEWHTRDGSAANDLEAPARRLQSEIGRLLEDMRAADAALVPHMSGSGAACFAVCADSNAAGHIVKSLNTLGWWAVATRFAE